MNLPRLQVERGDLIARAGAQPGVGPGVEQDGAVGLVRQLDAAEVERAHPHALERFAAPTGRERRRGGLVGLREPSGLVERLESIELGPGEAGIRLRRRDEAWNGRFLGRPRRGGDGEPDPACPQ
jgi:hypothetical protein